MRSWWLCFDVFPVASVSPVIKGMLTARFLLMLIRVSYVYETLSSHTSILQSLHIFPNTCNRTAFFKVGSIINYSYFLSKKFNSDEGKAGINLECWIRQILSFSDVAARIFDNWEIWKVSWKLYLSFPFSLLSSFV